MCNKQLLSHLYSLLKYESAKNIVVSEYISIQEGSAITINTCVVGKLCNPSHFQICAFFGNCGRVAAQIEGEKSETNLLSLPGHIVFEWQKHRANVSVFFI